MTFDPDWVSPPGDTILDILEEKEISIKQFYAVMDLDKKFTEKLLKGKERITPLIAEKLQKILGAKAEFWLNRDKRYVRNCLRLGLDKSC